MSSITPLPDSALKQLFLDARSYSGWQDKVVTDELIKKLYDLTKMGPTSMNCSPLRILFLRTEEAKQRLIPALKEGNVWKVEQAPVTAILAYDRRFYDKLPELFPHTDARPLFVGNEPFIEDTAFRNSTLQGGYFILAARALGLDCGPISGFDNDKVDKIFFAESDHHYRSNFICNIGYGDRDQLFPRSPRLAFEDCCQLL